MPVSEKQKEYARKYQTEKCDEIKLRPPKGTKDRWKAAADARGESLSQFIIGAVNSRIAKDER